MHVSKVVCGGFRLARQVWDWLHEDVVRLQDEDVVGRDGGQELLRRKELAERLRPVEHLRHDTYRGNP